MNEQLRPHPLPAATQAAEGLPRRRFTVAEIRGMVAGGIIAEDERFELIGGEVVPKSPKGNLDPTGEYFVWTANSGTGRLDAFVVRIPTQKLGVSAPAPSR